MNSRIDPRRLALWRAIEAEYGKPIREVLAEGITHRGTTVRNYYDGEGKAGEFQERLAVYGRGNQPCPRCGTPVVRSRVAGRGTYICPNCQVVKP